MAGNFALFAESKKRSAPQVNCASLLFPLSPEPCKNMMRGYFLLASKLIGDKILQSRVSSPEMNNCFSNRALFCEKVELMNANNKVNVNVIFFIGMLTMKYGYNVQKKVQFLKSFCDNWHHTCFPA